MKRFLMFAMMAVVAFAMHAQLYVGGSLGFSSTKVGDAKSANKFSLAPEIGYHFNPTWAIGASLEYESDLDNVSGFGVSPYVRAVFAKAGAVRFFGDAVLSFGSIKGGDYSDTVWGFALRPGMIADVSDRVSLVTSMYLFQHAQMDDLKTTTFGINNEVNLGFIYRF